MRKILAITTLSIILIAGFLSQNHIVADGSETTTSSECTKMKKDVFEVGESLTYRVYYNWTAVWMRAGNATFDIKSAEMNGKTVWHTLATGTTAKAFNWMFKVEDHFESYIDPATILPVKFIRNVKEGNYTKHNIFTFHHDKKEVFVNQRTRKGKVQAKDETNPISGCTQDLLSSIYYVRCIDYSTMKPNDSVEVDVFIDGKLYPIRVTYLGKEVVKIKGMGKFNCVKFSPELIEGLQFKGGEKQLIVYATDDQNRLPLLIESPLSFGSVKAYLKTHSGLKYDLASKIK